ncbi:MAG TPA: glycosyltransferase family 4 protein [Pirellulales bacterium]
MAALRIAYIAAGAGGMYCGNCLHDNTLAAAMIAAGHDVALIPTYTPIKTDEKDVSLRRVFMGGVNVYLGQTSPWLGRLPKWIRRLLDSPSLLRFATSFGISMKAEKLGPLAVSVLKGEHGNQVAEMVDLADFLADEIKPDVVHLSNCMIAGLAGPIRRKLNVPILSTLSGEDLFLQMLSEPFTTQAKTALREAVSTLDGFVAMNRYYADAMVDLLQVDAAKMHVIPHGLNLSGFSPRPPRPADAPFTIGYLGRISPEKGVALLAEAFCRLTTFDAMPPLKLRIAGYLAPSDKPYLHKIESTLRHAKLLDHFEHVGEVDHRGKLDFLHSLDLLSMPTTYPESKGLPVLEALACGVPVVAARHGAFPELLADHPGGLLCEPNNVDSLAASLARFGRDRAYAEQLGAIGRAAILESSSAPVMAARTIALYERLLAERAAASAGAAISEATPLATAGPAA